MPPVHSIDILVDTGDMLYDETRGGHAMKTLIKLPFKIILLPVIFVIGLVSLLAKIVVNTSMFIISPVICLCALFSIYCAVQFGFLGFLIDISVAGISFFVLLAAFLAIDLVDGVNSRLIGFLFS